MEDFKSNPKMQCFKEGGQVKYESRKEHKEEMSADMAQDKAIVKKAIGMHDKQEHPGEKTDLSKLRKGGRAKKDCGTVKKYKAGGNVTNVYEAKKKSGDKDNIAKVKQITPTKATAKSAPVGEPKNTPTKFCGGKSVKKMADGGIMDAIGNAGTALRNNVMGTPEQNRIAQARMDMIAKKKAAEQAALLGGLGGPAALQQGAMAGAQMQGVQPKDLMQQMANSPEAMPKPAMPTPAVPAPAGVPMQKRGGKVKKC